MLGWRGKPEQQVGDVLTAAFGDVLLGNPGREGVGSGVRGPDRGLGGSMAGSPSGERGYWWQGKSSKELRESSHGCPGTAGARRRVGDGEDEL